jgi:hypothetical protein
VLTAAATWETADATLVRMTDTGSVRTGCATGTGVVTTGVVTTGVGAATTGVGVAAGADVLATGTGRGVVGVVLVWARWREPDPRDVPVRLRELRRRAWGPAARRSRVTRREPAGSVTWVSAVSMRRTRAPGVPAADRTSPWRWALRATIVWTAGGLCEPSCGQPLKATSAPAIVNRIAAPRMSEPAVPRPAR